MFPCLPADATGAEIERALVATARAHRNITFHEHHLALDLLGEWWGCECRECGVRSEPGAPPSSRPANLLGTGG